MSSTNFRNESSSKHLVALLVFILSEICFGLTSGQAFAQADPKTAVNNTDSSNATAANTTAASAVVAQVNDTPITRGEVDRGVAMLTQGRAIEPGAMPQFQALALSQIIDQRILLDYLSLNKLNAAPSAIEARITELRTALKQQNVSLEQRLSQTGQSMSLLRAQLATELSLQKFVQSTADEQSLKAFYKSNAKHFDGTQLRVSHILLRPTQSGNQAETAELVEQAADLKQQIESGKLTFAAAAEKFSAGPSRLEAGDLGLIGREGPMVDAFNRAAFALEPKEISPPITTPFGVHLITVTEVKPGKKTLDEVKAKVLPALAQELIQKLMTTERASARVVFNDRFPHYKLGTRELMMPR